MRGWFVTPVMICGVLAGCVAPGDYNYSAPSKSSGSSYNSSPEPAAQAEPQRQERTIVHPDGRVTIIQRDPDGTRTYIDSERGVRVVPPGPGGHRDRCDR